VFSVGFDFGHPVGFQAQLFSDKRFNEHLGSFPFSGCVETAIKGYIGIEVPFFSSLGLGALKALSSDYTFGIGTQIFRGTNTMVIRRS